MASRGAMCGFGALGWARGSATLPSHPQIYWPAPVEWREECNWAGKDITVRMGWGGRAGWALQRGLGTTLCPQADCMNFVKILHAYNRTHLYACGTGAFHPTCAFVEVGQHTEVRCGMPRCGTVRHGTAGTDPTLPGPRLQAGCAAR